LLGDIGRAIRTRLSYGNTVYSATSFEMQFPILLPLRAIYNEISKETNGRRIYRTLKETDPELSGAIDRICKMVRESYQGLAVNVGQELSPAEEEILKIVKDFETEWRVKDRFYSIAEDMLTYGDSVYVTKTTEIVGLSDFRPLPMEYVTAVEKEEQIGSVSEQIYKANIYILNESNEEKLDKWNKDEITHFALNNISTTIEDLEGRYTFGVWSRSPVESLKARLLWKLSLLINDIMLRQHLVPRQHHKINLDSFQPQFFPGDTVEERYEAAKAAAEKYLTDYKTNVATPLKEVDKSIITGMDVEINYLEPRSVTYIDPNPQIDQINRSILAAYAPIETAVTGRGERSYASELVVSSYATLIAEDIADIIRQGFLAVVKNHIKQKYNHQYDDDLDKIEIKIQMVLGIERGERVRQGAVLSASEAITPDEYRNMVGLDPLTEEQKAQIIRRQGPGRGGDFVQTPGDINRDFITSDPDRGYPDTPESRQRRQVT